MSKSNYLGYIENNLKASIRKGKKRNTRTLLRILRQHGKPQWPVPVGMPGV